jgi:indoleamine 2,3-dioxygenase
LDYSKNTAEKVNPMLEMREYICGRNRRFFEYLERGPQIRTWALEKGDEAVKMQFNRCITEITRLRDLHIQTTTLYIILQQKKDTAYQADAVGTGGTQLVPFLKQTRDETQSARI